MVLSPLTPVTKDTISLEMKQGRVTTVNGLEKFRHVKVWLIAALFYPLICMGHYYYFALFRDNLVPIS